jgi:hypothetical protein
MRRGAVVAQTMETRAAHVAAQEIIELPTLVVVQGRPMHKALRRLTGQQQADRVTRTVENIRAQAFDAGKLSVVATVNNPGFDFSDKQTNQLESLGVQLISQKPGTSAAESINAAVRQTPMESGVVVPMYAGNRFVTDQALRAASLRIGEGAVGVYGPRLMDANPTKAAYGLLSGGADYFEQFADADPRPSPQQNGYMSDAGAAVNARILNNDLLPAGVPDDRGTRLNEWAADHRGVGAAVWYDPALALHDSTAAIMSPWMLAEEASWNR